MKYIIFGNAFSYVVYLFVNGHLIKEKNNIKIPLYERLLEWMLVDHVAIKHGISPGKFFVVNYDFRKLVINLFKLAYDAAFLYPTDTLRVCFFITVYILTGLTSLFWRTNEYFFLEFKTKYKFFLNCKCMLLKFYAYFFIIHLYFKFSVFFKGGISNDNMFQESLIKFMYFYSYLYYFFD